MSPDQRALLAVSAVGYDTASHAYLLSSVARVIRAAEIDEREAAARVVESCLPKGSVGRKIVRKIRERGES